MKTIKLKIYAILSVVTLALIAGCSSIENSNGIKYVEGYYIIEMPYSFDKVYSAALESIKTGETYTINGVPYDLKINSNANGKAILEGVNDNDLKDTIRIEIVKLSDKLTKVAIKYGKDGNSIRSSAEVQIIEGNIKYG
ncbi:hypothetical protein LA56_873 [Francisella philomiragia]|uniref:DUF3568 family protein n=1 Tax=Francisella philomiragia TaxID=28110 RepID=UPI0005A579E5|nr:DUF3568 family protein [Francisella philomiragia]AJI55770.1 hypothetical protein LA56_873 [Francisella philomiragia]MBK2253606.1 DUF3568 family protein [Francisella philomiragia]